MGDIVGYELIVVIRMDMQNQGSDMLVLFGARRGFGTEVIIVYHHLNLITLLYHKSTGKSLEKRTFRCFLREKSEAHRSLS